MIIQDGLVFGEDGKFSRKNIYVKDDKIEKVTPGSADSTSSDDVISAKNCYIIPGLVDVHFHGCVGHDFCDGSEQAIAEMAAYQLQSGITAICPATMTLAADDLEQICETAGSYQAAATSSDLNGADLCGIHLEGPFIAEKRKGAQNASFIQKPNTALYKRLYEKSNGLTKLITIAPEVDGALEFIRENSDSLHISLGHTTADYETARKALSAGADHITHLYNAMPPLHHRDGGLISAALLEEGTYVELICDGIHIAPEMILSTFKMFGDERVVLISDSMRAAGMPDGQYDLGGQDVTVNGTKATLKDGTIAGSVTNLFKCMQHAIDCGISIESAIKAATANPAKSIGLYDTYGSISSKKMANLLILNSDLSIRDIIFHGQRLS